MKITYFYIVGSVMKMEKGKDSTSSAQTLRNNSTMGIGLTYTASSFIQI